MLTLKIPYSTTEDNKNIILKLMMNQNNVIKCCYNFLRKNENTNQKDLIYMTNSRFFKLPFAIPITSSIIFYTKLDDEYLKLMQQPACYRICDREIFYLSYLEYNKINLKSDLYFTIE